MRLCPFTTLPIRTCWARDAALRQRGRLFAFHPTIRASFMSPAAHATRLGPPRPTLAIFLDAANVELWKRQELISPADSGRPIFARQPLVTLVWGSCGKRAFYLLLREKPALMNFNYAKKPRLRKNSANYVAWLRCPSGHLCPFGRLSGQSESIAGFRRPSN